MNDEAFNILKGKMAPKSTVKTKEMSTEPTNKETKILFTSHVSHTEEKRHTELSISQGENVRSFLLICLS
jgi:hypothetical protein